MNRIRCRRRNNWQETFLELGFSFSPEGARWNEGFCYEFSRREIDHIEEVTGDLHEMCMAAAGHVIETDLISRLGIPARHHPLIRESWRDKDRSVCGRMDFVYNGRDEPRLLEYDADSPSGLFESAILQRLWLQDLFPDCDQFNSLHEKLAGVFKSLSAGNAGRQPFYFTCAGDRPGDFVTAGYLRDIASQSGLDARHISMEDIGYDADSGSFIDPEKNGIRQMFKLCPWERLLARDAGRFLSRKTIRVIEPAWKMVLSCRGLLPVLWEMFPGHPNLLPSYFGPGRISGDCVRKPLLSGKASGTPFNGTSARQEATDGTDRDSGFVYQKMDMLPNFEGSYALVGSWVINTMPAGICIREDDTPITRDSSLIVPHFFLP